MNDQLSAPSESTTTATSTTTTTLRMLIPWDDETVRDALVAFAHAIGGADASISLMRIDASCQLGLGAVPPTPGSDFARDAHIHDALPGCANDIVETAETGAADMILLGTSCQPGGEFDCTCLRRSRWTPRSPSCLSAPHMRVGKRFHRSSNGC
ncbi:MAG: hypothetical protein ACR2OE_11865 [Thermomicrobiales bacterium]